MKSIRSARRQTRFRRRPSIDVNSCRQRFIRTRVRTAFVVPDPLVPLQAVKTGGCGALTLPFTLTQTGAYTLVLSGSGQRFGLFGLHIRLTTLSTPNTVESTIFS